MLDRHDLPPIIDLPPSRKGGRRVSFNGNTYFLSGGAFLRNCVPSEEEALLHREIWRLAYGDIPEGCQIHHLDKDRANNALANLVLFSRHEHMSLHSKERSSWVVPRLIAGQKTEEASQHKSAGQLRRWADPQERQKQSIKLKKVLSAPAARFALSARTIEQWSDPLMRAKMTNAMKGKRHA